MKTSQPHDLSPLRFSQDGNKVQVILIDYKNRTEVIYPEQLLAMLLFKIKVNAESQFQCPIQRCVITVPSCFNEKQRVSVEDSCKIAGFHDVQTINDTTAAAITYVIQRNYLNEGHYILIIDIGAYSTEASIAFVTKNSVFIKANVGESDLGGENFVQILVKHFINEFKTQTGVNLINDDKTIARLRFGCEELKKILSTGDSAKVTLESFYQGNPFDLIMSRETFEFICANLFRKIIDVGRKLFQSTLIQKSVIQATILVGGGTRIPKIQQDLKAFMHGEELSRVLNQDEAVATGAAYYATGNVHIEELPKPTSLFGECAGLDILKMQQLLQRFEDDEVALVEYMAQVNDLEKLCYSYKRAILKQNVFQEDENLVVEKCNKILSFLENAQQNILDKDDFRRLSKELKESYALACNKKKDDIKQPITNHVHSNKVNQKKEEKHLNQGQELFDQGVALLSAERYGDAAEIFTYFIQMSNQQTYPEHITINDLYSYRAHCYFNLKMYDNFFKDFHKISKNRRTPALKEMFEQATDEIYLKRAANTLRKVQSLQRDEQTVTTALSMITSVLDTRPTNFKNFVQIHQTAQLYHQRSILHFKLRNYDHALSDAYQNMKIIHDNKDLSEERDQMYRELKIYLKLTPKSKVLYKKYGQQTCNQYAYVKQCIKESEKRKNRCC